MENIFPKLQTEIRSSFIDTVDVTDACRADIGTVENFKYTCLETTFSELVYTIQKDLINRLASPGAF